MKPHTNPVHIISLGAGVQSSTMALMAAHGLITPHPVAAIFADTQDEPATDNFQSTAFKRKSCKPLDTVDFSTEEERGQGTLWNDGFTAECEGMCGV